ncbi:MAG: uroporphyrinogen-III synthase [Alphaproteobacteria bacterium]|nr:uroporphyrinogen-III synthase [Alphaproteobacteria bacterium]
MQSSILLVGSAERLPVFQEAFQVRFPSVDIFSISNHKSLPLSKGSLNVIQESDGVLLTSALALSGVDTETLQRFPPFYCVGKKSAEMVRALGGRVAYEGTGSAQGLLRALIKEEKISQKFVHLCGTSSGDDWYIKIRENSGSITPILTYKAFYKNKVSLSEQKRIETANVLVFLSQAALEKTQAMCLKYNVDTSNKSIVCLSRDIALKGKGWKSVSWADRPQKESLIKAVELAVEY